MINFSRSEIRAACMWEREREREMVRERESKIELDLGIKETKRHIVIRSRHRKDIIIHNLLSKSEQTKPNIVR